MKPQVLRDEVVTSHHFSRGKKYHVPCCGRQYAGVDSRQPWLNKKYLMDKIVSALFDNFSSFLLSFGFSAVFRTHHCLYITVALIWSTLFFFFFFETLWAKMSTCWINCYRNSGMCLEWKISGSKSNVIAKGCFWVKLSMLQEWKTVLIWLPLKLNNLTGQDVAFEDPSHFRILASKLQYLTLTRPDLQFAVNYIWCMFPASLTSVSWKEYSGMLKRLMKGA